jgi:uncharacterized membrane protein YjdF
MDHFFYWRFWWYDIMMHFTGGILIGGLILWGILRVRPNVSRGNLLLMLVIGTIIVGIGWEVMEYMGGITQGEAGYVFDTVKDLIMDTLGGLVAWTVFTLATRSTSPKEII